MSRFVEILNRYRREIAIQNVGKILREMKRMLQARSAHLEMEFPYFIRKEAPVSHAPSIMEYQCRFIGSLDDRVKLYLGVSVPITTLCPCSKELSEHGAHNQRAEIRVLVRFRGFLWIEDLIELVEGCGSAKVYALLKREDEKFVTEHAYENPMFVEDVAREVAHRLDQDERVVWYEIEVESYESIHNHNAYAYIKKRQSEGL
jgi:GTP cyclohydrolase I